MPQPAAAVMLALLLTRTVPVTARLGTNGPFIGSSVCGKNAGGAPVHGGILAGSDRAVGRYRDFAVRRTNDRRRVVLRKYAGTAGNNGITGRH